jgi:hypothetical protein
MSSEATANVAVVSSTATAQSAAELRAPRESISSAGSSALDLHEGIGSTQLSGGCPRWPDGLRLESTVGQLVKGRCKSTNLCDYCAKLAAVENAEVLALDAMTNEPPQLWSVLTTRTATIDTSSFKLARREVRRAVLRRWPGAQQSTLIEFTSGLGTNSGGERRPHWNDAHKGIPVEDAAELEDVMATAWCKNVDAGRRAQKVTPITDTGGLMRYLALHFQKESQQPPTGWRGHRFRTSAGYLAQPMAQAREQARQSLRLRRELWKAQQAGWTGEEADNLAHQALEDANALAWELVRLVELPTAFGRDGFPTAWEDAVFPVALV